MLVQTNDNARKSLQHSSCLASQSNRAF